MPNKATRPAAAKGRAENGFMKPQGAPRGLLHFYALWKIGGKPMSGYQLMQDIEAKTEGAWRPGPGAIYPILKKLAGEGYIRETKGERKGSSQTVYEITASGRNKIAVARKAFGSSGERWTLMRRVFSDLMEPEDLSRFVIESPSRHFEFVHELVLSNGDRISHEDKLYLLRQYNLLLERELNWSVKALKTLAGSGTSKAPAREAQPLEANQR
jgi:DNA-binding PadR family transcriptional regulator